MAGRPNWPANSPTEVSKLQQHLALLKKEYVKLQNHCGELEKKFSITNARDKSEDSFVSRLLQTVAGLYSKKQYSDINILLANAEEIPAHRFVLKSRSSEWGVPDLDATIMLDWSDAGTEVMTSLLLWVYTGEVELKLAGDDFCLDLMKASAKFHLAELTNKCEQELLLSVGVHNCVRLYTTADEIGAATLREHCSNLISVHWDDFTSDDFAHMTAPLLFSMLKAKTSYPLHSAVRLAREDVVFLYLVEFSKELSRRLNEADGKGDLPLLLALQSRQSSLATTLVEHGSSVDARDPRGHTLLLSAVEREDAFSCLFLLEHNACTSATTSELGDTGLHILANQHAESKLQDEESTNPESEQDQKSEEMMQVAQKLLDCGLNPNLQNSKGYTALQLSVMNGHESLFTLLLSWPGLALDSPTLEGHTALRFALARDVRHNNLMDKGFAGRLLEKKANPNPMYPASGDTLLHLMAREENETAAMFLCSKGADVLRTNKRGESALHIACQHGLSQLVTTLLTSGALPNLQTLPSGEEGGVYRQTPLHMAIQHRQEEAINAILLYKESIKETSKDVDLNLKNSEGLTSLSLALTMGLKLKVPQLIAAGADVNVVDSQGLTLLHQSLKAADSESALFLLEQGANMDCITPDGHTPLQLAISHSLPSVVEGLCRRGVDMSVLDSKSRCPLWAALESNEEDIASILVRNGVDTDCWGPGPDSCLQTLLHKALDENQTSIACFLIQSGCELNATRRPGPNGEGGEEAKDKQTPLHMACTWGLEQVVQTLVEHGAAVNVRDSEGKTPLHVAVANQHAHITSLLLCHPALDLSLRDKHGLTPFAAALTSRNNKAAQAILDRLPTAAEQYDNKGYNFLHTAVQRGDLESVLFLLSIGVDANSRVRDSTMSTPLHLACATNAAKSNNDGASDTSEDSALVVRNLILAGARPDERDATRRTALHAAALSGHSAAALALLQNGANPDATDADLNSPLHLATKASQLEVVRVLLTESTMDAEAKNLRGQTPLHLLANYGRDQVAAAICELFRECMPTYPLDQPDLEGNTALLLAYMRGNVGLCKALVKAGCCLGSMNKEGVTIFNYQVPTKQLLHKLLDMLSKEPPWAEGDMCLECGSKFGLTMRKHHCRHCGRLLCSKCSSCDVPILKFGLNKPVRVCNVCFQVLQIGSAT